MPSIVHDRSERKHTGNAALTETAPLSYNT